MLYCVKLDEDLETLEIKQAKNIHQLSKIIKVAGLEINDFLNGTDKPVEGLASSTMPFPYIKKNGECYYFSYYKPIIEKRNYPWMSKVVITELQHMSEFDTITATSSRKKVDNG